MTRLVVEFVYVCLFCFSIVRMANMTRLVVEFVDVCLFCFSIVRMANMARLKWTETILLKHLRNGRVWANMTKLLKMTIPIHMTTEKDEKNHPVKTN